MNYNKHKRIKLTKELKKIIPEGIGDRKNFIRKLATDKLRREK